jgi:hypothetical protein
MTPIRWSSRTLPLALLMLAACGGGGGGGSSTNPPPPGDNIAPDTTLTATPPAHTNQTTLSFTATSNEAGTTFQARLDDASFATVASTFSFNGITEGAHRVDVRAVDAAGNVDASPATFQVTVDQSPPETAFTLVPSQFSNSSTANFEIRTDPDALLDASLDGAPFARVTSTPEFAGLAEGTHTLAVRSTDLAGNIDATPAQHSWTVDVTPPTLRVHFPGLNAYSDSSFMRLRGSVADAHPDVRVAVNGTLTGWWVVGSEWEISLPLPAGVTSFVVHATDLAGNVSEATTTVTNRGTVAQDLLDLAFHAATNRLVITDPERRALLAVNPATRSATVISDATRGTGIAFQQPAGLALDGARALVSDTSLDQLISVDLATGNRASVAPAAALDADRLSMSIAYDATMDIAYSPTLDGRILALDLGNGGGRSVISGGGVGTGPDLGQVLGLILDSSTGTSRLLATGDYGHAVIAIDPATGDRTFITYAAPLDLANQVGTGPALYGLGRLVVDTTPGANRLFAVDIGANRWSGRLYAIDLASGNRTVLASGTADVVMRETRAVAFDAATARAFIGLRDRARVLSFELGDDAPEPFFDSLVGNGFPITYPTGLAFDTSSGHRQLLTASRSPVPTLYRVDLATGERIGLSQPPGAGTGPAFTNPGNLVIDERDGQAGSALFFDTDVGGTTLALRGVDLVFGNRTLLGSAPLGANYSISRMSHDLAQGRAVAGINPLAGGSGSVVAMDITTGALTTLSSLSVGNGPPLFDIAAVAPTPPDWGTTTRYLVAAGRNIFGVNGSGDRTFISASDTIGPGPMLASVEDMEVQLAQRRALVVGTQDQAMQWVNLDSGAKTMVSGRETDFPWTNVWGDGPLIRGNFAKLAIDATANVAYVSVYNGAFMAVDLRSGTRALVSR